MYNNGVLLLRENDHNMKNILSIIFGKKYIGIWLAILFYILFSMVTSIYRYRVDGTVWFLVNSLQRLLFGLIELMLFMKCFQKKDWKEVLNFKGYKKGLLAGSGIILFIIYFVILYITGVSGIVGLTFPLAFSQLFCQQITTGFFEEITYRGFILEGYFYHEKQKVSTRLIYTLVSFLLFGSGHLMNCTSWSDGVFRMVTTGIIGMSFTAIYLYSHNLLIAMILHFIFDIPANLIIYANWSNTVIKVFLDDIFYGMYIIIGITSLIFIIKAGNNSNCQQEAASIS